MKKGVSTKRLCAYTLPARERSTRRQMRLIAAFASFALMFLAGCLNPFAPEEAGLAGDIWDDQATIGGRAGQLFESGLAIAPDNPRALFYAGLAAAQRGDTLLAADRWELLLALSPPEQLQDILRQRVAEWRGEPTPEQPPSLPQPAGVVAVDIAIGDVTARAIDPAAVVFIIARDPAQPSPPVAVKRRRAGDFPTVVTIADSDAMVPGRLPSAYEQLEIIVRVSASGQPMAQPGDWFGQGSLRPADGTSIAIVVDQQVP